MIPGGKHLEYSFPGIRKERDVFFHIVCTLCEFQGSLKGNSVEIRIFFSISLCFLTPELYGELVIPTDGKEAVCLEKEFKQIFERAKDLREKTHSLSKELMEACRKFEQTGHPIRRELLDAAADFHDRFDVLREDVASFSEKISFSPRADARQIFSLKAMSDCLKEIGVKGLPQYRSSRKRERMAKTIGLLRGIRHKNGNESPSMDRFRKELERVESLIDDVDPKTPCKDIVLLEKGEHILNAVERLLNQENLPDDEWESLGAKVKEAFGTSFFRELLSRDIRAVFESADPEEEGFQGQNDGRRAENDGARNSEEPLATVPNHEGPASPGEVGREQKQCDDSDKTSNVEEELHLPEEPELEPEPEPEDDDASDERPVDFRKPNEDVSQEHEDSERSVSEDCGRDAPEEVVADTLPVLDSGLPNEHADLETYEDESSSVPPDPSVAHSSRDLVISTIQPSFFSHLDTPDDAVFSCLSLKLLLQNRGSLAYHVQRLLEGIYGRQSTHLPSALLRDVLLGRRALSSTGEIAQILKTDFEEIDFERYASLQGEWADTLHLLTASATLRPALLAPSTNAGAVLNSIRFSFISVQSFLKIIRAASEFGTYSRPLEPNWLKGRSAWERSVKDAVDRANQWFEKATVSTTNYRPATAVWRFLMTSKAEEDGVLSIEKMIAPVRSGDVDKLTDTMERLKFFSERSNREQTIDIAFQAVSKKQHGGKIKGIEAIARDKLLRNIQEACEIAENWVRLHEAAKSHDASYLKKHAEDFKNTFEKNYAEAREELLSLERKHMDTPLEAGLHCAVESLDDIKDLFDPSKVLPSVEPRTKTLLNSGLLKTGLRLDENMGIAESDAKEGMRSILRFLSSEEPLWSDVIAERKKRKDSTGLRAIAEHLRENEPDAADIEALERELQENEREWSDQLRIALELAQNDIEDALNSGLLKEAERGALLGKTEAMNLALETRKEKAVDFENAAAVLKEIEEELAEKRRNASEECRARVRKEGINEGHPFFERINDLLSRNDFLTAESYIQMASEGRELPQESRNIFSEFFPKKAGEIEDSLLDPVKGSRQPSKNSLLELMRKQSKVCGVDMKYVPGKQAQQAAYMMTAWWDAAKSRKISEEQARIILGGLGFNVLKVSVSVEFGRCWIDLRAETLADRNLCPVACYGSSARGCYRILCDWDRPSEERILSSIPAPGMLKAPVIVFHFGCFTHARRRALAARSLEEKKTFLLIDDTLMLFLCGERNERLNPMFRCTLPFTYIQPFVTSASVLPPEMFYGRQEELEEIISPSGACLVYGGRQLGKTVLLRDAERRFNDGEHKIAVWIDLESEGVGSRLSSVWEVFARKLKRIFPEQSYASQISAEKFSEMTRSWLNKDPRRRILLLLDEADSFFERDFCNTNGKGSRNEDAGEFMVARKLKALMDETERRFKVVFAGLHNVGRNTKSPNNPIAHLGTPVCVGPLIERQEHLQARALVREPFQVAGYEISEDLITRILTQTNYYPSLIQIYCHNLLMYLTSRQQRQSVRFSSNVPPFEITRKHLDGAYEDRDLRNTIREKFLLTLQLDERYRVIAYALAFNVLLQEDSGLVEGFSENAIFRWALEYWPAGFEGCSTLEEFRVILDEMVGLGVLTQLEGGRYTFRGRNVPLLLGTEEEVFQILCSPREPLPEYNPATYCPPIQGTSLRSPLTVLQEEVLLKRRNGVVVVAGSKAAGLDDLRQLLEKRLEPAFYHPMEHLELSRARSDFAALVSKEMPKGLHIIFFDCETTPWTRQWLSWFKDELEKSRANGGKLFRVIFSANPSTLWEVMSEEGRVVDECDDLLTLTKWHERTLKHWLQEREYIPSAFLEKEGVEKIRQFTGGWVTMLRLVAKGASARHRNAEDFLREIQTAAESRDFVKTALRDEFQLLENDKRKVILNSIKELSPVSSEDLVSLYENEPSFIEAIRGTIRWAETLQYVHADEEDRLRIDPVVKRLLDLAEHDVKEESKE